MRDSREVLRILENLLNDEIALYSEYLTALQNEKQHVRKHSSDDIRPLTAKREELYRAMKASEKKRLQLVAEIAGTPGPGNPQIKLSDFIKSSFSATESKRMLAKVEKLKELVKKCHRESQEFSQMVNFSLNMVSGLISIFWSATQNVVRSYNQRGKMRENFSPASTRAAGLLKQV